MEMKSKIRSRWYRANEKPLESQGAGTSPSQNPIGEISIGSKEALKDDLNDESARKASSQRPVRNIEGGQDRKNSRHDRKPRRRPGDKSDRNFKNNKGREHRNNESKDSLSENKKAHHKPNHTSPKSHSKNSKARRPVDSNKPAKQNTKPDKKPKSGVSKFLSKLFGS
jgi:hypothetical protein